MTDRTAATRAAFEAVARLLPVLVLALSILPATAAWAGDRGILIVSSSSPAFPRTTEFLAGVDDEMSQHPGGVSLYFEFLDRARLAGRADNGLWTSYLMEKYRDASLAAIVADGPEAIDWATRHGGQVSGGAPLIGIFPESNVLGALAESVAVKVSTGPFVDETVDIALAQWPNAERAVIISDKGRPSFHQAESVKRVLSARRGDTLLIEHAFDFRLEDLEAKLATLPRGSIVFYTQVFSDSTGRRYRPDKVAARLANVSAAPVYTFSASHVGTGVVGGMVNDPRAAGRVAAQVVMELLDGKSRDRDASAPAADARGYPSKLVLDWRQLNRWGVDLRTVPAEADIRFRPLPLLEAYFAEAMVGLAVILVLGTVLLAVSVLYVMRGRHARALNAVNSELEERIAARTRDIERALAAEQLTRQRLRAFVDMATHEFKTPLSTIDSTAQVLELLVDAKRQEVGDRLRLIRKSVRRVVDLVETCLSGERYEDLAATFTPFSPADVVKQAAERQRRHGLADLAVDVTGLPAECVADPELLGIALDALLDNARRYAATSGPIEMSARRDGESLLFSVRDRGPGVPADDAERIFEKYFRSSANSRVPGTGIGLHVVRTITDLHGGTVRYRPRDGGGAEFTIAIPMRHAESTPRGGGLSRHPVAAVD